MNISSLINNPQPQDFQLRPIPTNTTILRKQDFNPGSTLTPQAAPRHLVCIPGTWRIHHRDLPVFAPHHEHMSFIGTMSLSYALSYVHLAKSFVCAGERGGTLYCRMCCLGQETTLSGSVAHLQHRGHSHSTEADGDEINPSKIGEAVPSQLKPLADVTSHH